MNVGAFLAEYKTAGLETCMEFKMINGKIWCFIDPASASMREALGPPCQ